MPKGSRANSVLFGFDFQVNAAIVLMLENLKDLQTLKLEGKNEDIELKLSTNKYIFAQAKSVVNASSDFTNVRSNLRKALKTLSAASQNKSVQNLILITNSRNPFNEVDYQNLFCGETRKYFAELPDSSQNLIKDYLSEIEQPLNTDYFKIQVLPFEGDDELERYKFVITHVQRFLQSLKCGGLNGFDEELLYIWFDDVFKNGTKEDADIELDKKDIIWPLIVNVTDAFLYERDMADIFELDEGLFEEVKRKYKSLIKNSCERYEFITSVLCEFNKCQYTGSIAQKCMNFAKDNWQKFLPNLFLQDENTEVQEKVVQIIMYFIVKNRFQIDKIKAGVNL